MKILNIVVFLLLLNSCANIVMPTGGEKDTSSPTSKSNGPVLISNTQSNDMPPTIENQPPTPQDVSNVCNKIFHEAKKATIFCERPQKAVSRLHVERKWVSHISKNNQ